LSQRQREERLWQRGWERDLQREGDPLLEEGDVEELEDDDLWRPLWPPRPLLLPELLPLLSTLVLDRER